MNINRLRFTLRQHRPFLLHVLAWTVYLSMGELKNVLLRSGYHVHVLDAIVTAAPAIIIFYGHYYLLMKLGASRMGRWWLPLGIAGLFSVCALLYYVNGYLLIHLINPEDQTPVFRLRDLLIGTSWIYLVYSINATGYYFAVQAFHREKRLKELELRQLKIEQDRLQAEYAFLRAQINPHFLHNTLNFFYARSLACGGELSEGILTLSEIMRYSLEPNEGAGTVALASEVEHLKNVIRIHQLRFSHKLQVEFEINGDISGLQIIPLVLITLTENVLKHGALTDVQHPVKLRLEINEARNRLTFSTYNKTKRGPKELSRGIGVENIRQRLQWAYPGRYLFETGPAGDEGAYYFADLHIFFNGSHSTPVHIPLEQNTNAN